MRKLWLVESYVISCHNHHAQGDYNTEAPIFKIAAALFLDVSEEETNGIKENSVALIINHLSNYTKTIILLRLSEYCRIIPSTSSRALCDNMHFVLDE